jgi:hypothetical protein
MTERRRRIGPLGTGARVAVGLGLFYLAGAADGLPWDVDWHDPVVGLVVLPWITLALGLVARRRAPPLRYTGPAAHLLNCALIVALLSIPYTSAGAALSSRSTRPSGRGSRDSTTTTLPPIHGGRSRRRAASTSRSVTISRTSPLA